jgi:tight adherence protein C
MEMTTEGVFPRHLAGAHTHLYTESSIAHPLRVYAVEMRDKRVIRAEEKANKLPTKMTLATMMLTVPPLLIILVGPSVLGIMELFAMAE